jgi:hypothetical protein
MREVQYCFALNNCHAIERGTILLLNKEQKDGHFALLSAGCASQRTLITCLPAGREFLKLVTK